MIQEYSSIGMVGLEAVSKGSSCLSAHTWCKVSPYPSHAPPYKLHRMRRRGLPASLRPATALSDSCSSRECIPFLTLVTVICNYIQLDVQRLVMYVCFTATRYFVQGIKMEGGRPAVQGRRLHHHHHNHPSCRQTVFPKCGGELFRITFTH